MESRFWTDDRVATFGRALDEHPEWPAASKYFDGLVRLSDGVTSVDLDIRSGRIDTTTKASETVPDMTASGPVSGWLRMADGEQDWLQATTPGFGELNVEGSPVFLMRNIKIFYLIGQAVARTGTGGPCPKSSPPPRARHARPTGHYVDVDGIETYYEEAGDGPAVVCLHAAAQDTLMYRHVLAEFSNEFRVIAIDAPGHGKSLLPPAGPFTDLTQHAEFTERFLDTLGIERPVLVGCSMGGNEVLELGARRPGAYPAIISAEGADYTPGLDEFFLDMLHLNGQEMLECYCQSLTGNRTPPDRAREVVWQIRRATPEVARSDLQGYASFDKRDQMTRITDPVLLIRGNGDWLASQAKVEETASRIPHAKVAILDGTGHYPMIENPAEFNQTVRGFLHELGVTGRP